ncbi:hypothetical protein HPP92_017637 [Vanilla planifolia]|uniref:J domain-containing protein n=1 Tax=Vanilla planifolia TaxID=51239 RepID=A0A835UM45_VANPL|nr:hypothetical protein HPP92_018252 [Vanilla planifolia]KAG0468309.1 hypothetical protein HPP92_017637 [Vanilla planifolia]
MDAVYQDLISAIVVMWSRRNVYFCVIPILREGLRTHPSPSQEFFPHNTSSSIHSKSSLFLENSKVSNNPYCFDRLLPCHLYYVGSRLDYSTSLGKGDALACWNCGESAPLSGPFLACGVCRAVQPIDSTVDYFKIFGLEPGYNLNDENLEGKYKEWQKKLHPDLVHSKSDKEKSYAAEQSARVIDAYRTLGKPLSRALYLLQLVGVHVDEEKTVMDPELLAEMMDIRESVEAANEPQALLEIQCQLQKKLEEWSNSFREAFNKRDFDSAIRATHRMRYYERAIEEIVKKL